MSQIMHEGYSKNESFNNFKKTSSYNNWISNNLKNKLNKFDIIYNGSMDDSKYFNYGNIYLKPDLIIYDRDNKEYGIIEEKYHFYSDPNYYKKVQTIVAKRKITEQVPVFNEKVIKTAYLNNKVQLLMYLYILKEYDLKYGAMVYWNIELPVELPTSEYDERFSYEENPGFKVISSTLFKFNKTPENREILAKEYRRFINFNKVKQISFGELLIEKCKNCSKKFFCKHRFGDLNEVKLPYEY